MLLAMAEQAGDKSKQCLGRAECLVMVHWRHSGDLSESVSLPIAEVRLGVLGASRRPNSPSCWTKGSSRRDGQPGLAHKIQGRPPALRPRPDVCSNHVGVGFVRNFIACEFG
jgi:hypothetical protein